MTIFIHFLDAAFQDERLSRLDCEVLWRLQSCSGGYLAAQKHMVDWTGKNKGSISRSFGRLESFGYIERCDKGWRIPSETPLPELRGDNKSCADTTKSCLDTTKSCVETTSHHLLKYNKTKLNNNTQNTPSVSKPKSKTTICDKNSVPIEKLNEILNDPDYGNRNKELVRDCFLDMIDWSQSNSKRKADWTAALRGWIRRERKKGSTGGARNTPKTFTQLEQEHFDKQLADFMKEDS